MRAQGARPVAQGGSAFELEPLGGLAHVGFKLGDGFGQFFGIIQGRIIGGFVGNMFSTRRAKARPNVYATVARRIQDDKAKR